LAPATPHKHHRRGFESRPRYHLARITAPHFCAGFILKDRWVYKTAPILSYMLGWGAEKVKNYCDHKGWAISRVTT
jgi:hypothetical protein